MHFMRPGLCNGISSAQYAHVQLWNPAASGVLAKVKGIWVTAATRGYTIVGHQESTFGMFGDATFGESRGLPVDYDGVTVDFYSKSHVRIFKGAPVDGGQWFNCFQPVLPVHLDIPFVIRPGNGIVVRGANNGENLHVSYLWEETPLV